MNKKTYLVTVHYSTFCTYEIQAADENEAISIARKKPVDIKEVIANLENWKEADTAETIDK